MDPIPPEAFLEAFPPAIAHIGHRLRAAVLEAAPGAIERVRPGWHLIGFDAPNGRRTAYFAWVLPERVHIHLGFERGVLMTDPDRRLEGAGITKQVRWITFEPGDEVDAEDLAPLIVEARRVASLSKEERAFAAMAAAEAPLLRSPHRSTR
jgi:hypothetical protein